MEVLRQSWKVLHVLEIHALSYEAESKFSVALIRLQKESQQKQDWSSSLLLQKKQRRSLKVI